MSSEAVVIIGTGGHAKVVIELIRAEAKYQIKGCTGLGESGFVLGDVPILGTDSVLPALLVNGAKKAFVAIGDNYLRLRLLGQLSELGFELINAVSPHAVVSPSATLGRGIAIMAGRSSTLRPKSAMVQSSTPTQGWTTIVESGAVPISVRAARWLGMWKLGANLFWEPARALSRAFG